MTDRIPLDELNSDQLDALYDRIDWWEATHSRVRDRLEVKVVRATRRAEQAETERDGALHRLRFMDENTLPDMRRRAEADVETIRRWRQRAEEAEATVERVRRLAAVWDDAPDPLVRASARDLTSTLAGPKKPTQIHVMQDGEWVPVEGITSIEITADATALIEQFQRFRTAFQTAGAAWIEAAVPAMRAVARAAAAAQQADQSQYTLAPGCPRPARRPAWQSPYGPPQKGHRR